MESVRIGNRIIGERHPAYVIAEIGLNHQGDLDMARVLIDRAVDAGADAVKFQKRSLKALYKKGILDHINEQENALNYLLNHIVKCELTEEQITALHAHAARRGVDFLCTPWDSPSLHFLDTLNMPAHKIGSPDMFNLPLIAEMSKLKRPLIISTGMSYVSEIDLLIDFLSKTRAQYILLHCNSTYPSPYHDINLNFLKVLQEKSRFPVGYSGHEQGVTVCAAAVALGARVIEKHITLDRALPGPDHKASLLPDEFHDLVSQIRIVEESMGEAVRYPSRGEFLNREHLAKSLVVSEDMAVGDTLNYENIVVQSPGQGTSPMKLPHFIGRKLVRRPLMAGDYLLESDVDFYNVSTLAGLDIRHRWGIVARLCDIDELMPKTNPTFVEIHLTSSDVKMDPATMEGRRYDTDLVVHCPEYDDDLLLDLSSLDPATRDRSIAFFNQSLDHSRVLKRLFRNRNEDVIFVVHPGGMNMTERLTPHIDRLNENLADSLSRLDTSGFRLLVENMPPFPWYFGGQWMHSSFMDAEEIVAWSRQTGYGITFDTSHAALWCNFSGKSLDAYTDTILPITGYLHVSDAARLNGEGLKIGDGTIDFRSLLPRLTATNLWLLPEIWQGHKFGGEDFIHAVRSLKLINPDL